MTIIQKKTIFYLQVGFFFFTTIIKRKKENWIRIKFFYKKPNKKKRKYKRLAKYISLFKMMLLCKVNHL